jgi:hypothetical protein
MKTKSALLVMAVALLSATAWKHHDDRPIVTYPAVVCDNGCDAITTDGKTVKQGVVALAPRTFSAFPDRQEVVMDSGVLGLLNLPRDFGGDEANRMECRVMDQKNWECHRRNFSEVFRMSGGEFSHSDDETTRQGSREFQTTWCYWHQVKWHNDSATRDERPFFEVDAHPWIDTALSIVTGCRLGSVNSR